MLRVRFERYPAVHGRLQWRSLALLAGGSVAIVIGTFGLVLGFLLMAMPGSNEPFAWRAGLVVLLFAGVFPFALGSASFWRGIRRRMLIGRLRELVAYGRGRLGFEAADLAASLRITAREAELLAVDAASLELVEPLPAALLAAARAPAGARPDGGLAVAADPGAGDGWLGAVLNGAYAVEALVGTGATGAVYAARHVRTGRRYAVKTLLPDARLAPDAIARFEREAAAAGALGHPNIVAVHDFLVTAAGAHYLVMDLLEGETLEGRLARVGALPWRAARTRGLELASALAVAHAAGLLHRDLKPANVFLAGWRDAVGRVEERAVLLDFGLAKPLDGARITATGAALGTPLYMAPEQARGEPLDVRTDVYGLGAVLYEMVTGAPPFFDPTLANVYAKLLTSEAPRAAGLAPRPLPAAFDALLGQALARDRAARFEDMAAFARALAAVEGEDG